VVITIKAILQLDGYDVVTATSATQAREAVRATEFDLVLSDLRLEDGDGLDVLRAVRERSPDTVTIMLTGYASLESAIQALRAGAYDYLIKPSEVEELRSTVGRGIERRRLGECNAGEAQVREALRSVLEQLEIVYRQTGKLARLVDELLDVSRIQTGRIEFRYGDVDLGELAQEVATRMQLTTTAHEISV